MITSNKTFSKSLATVLALAILLTLGNPFQTPTPIFGSDYSVFFNSNGGTPTGYQPVNNGDKLMRPGDPVKSGYTFDGWYRDNGTFANPWNFGTDIVTGAMPETMALYAKWDINVTFNSNGGSPTPLYQVVLDGAMLTEPTVPSKQWSTFVGWYTDNGSFTNQWIFNTGIVTETMTLYAKWDTQNIQVTKIFETTTGSSLKVNSQVNVNLGTTFNEGPDTIQGYSYIGYKTPGTNSGNLVAAPAIPSISPLSDATDTTVIYVYEAVQYTLTYNDNGSTSGSAPPGGFYPYNGSVTVSDQGNLLKDNHTFLGWATLSGATAPDYTSGSTLIITAGTTLYAVWEDVKYDVTYQPGTYGTFSAQSTSNLSFGDATPSAPQTTVQAGWSFSGWSPIRSLTVSGNAIYVAQWTQNLYTVQFVDWNGTLLKSQQVAYSGNATEPTNPTRSGYTFIGWNRAHTNVQANMTVTALYRIVPTPPEPDTAPILYTVQFVNWDGTILKTQLIRSGYNATAPSAPTREGYTFTTWDNGYSNVQSNITVTALYESIVANNPTPTSPPHNATNTPSNTANNLQSATQKATSPQVHRQETLQTIKQSGLPVITIGNNEVPLVGLPGMMVWALANLILCVLGIIIALITTRHVLQRMKRYNTSNAIEHYRGKGMQLIRKQRNHVTLVIVTVMGILGIIVFMITENMTNLMVLVDQWTFINAAIFAVEITAAVLSSRQMKRNDKMAEREDRFTELFGQ